MQHKGTIVLETPRLILRRFVPEDLEPMFLHCWSEREVWKWTNYAPMKCMCDVMTNAHMFTPNWLGAYERPNRYSWAIHSKSDGHAIGRMFGMHPDDERKEIELAYELGSRWWNQGLMTEAVRATIDFFFLEVGLRRIHAYHADKNLASGRVMQKCGMHLVEIVPSGCYCNAGTFDRINYEILAEAYVRR